jgi:hypothetical protein
MHERYYLEALRNIISPGEEFILAEKVRQVLATHPPPNGGKTPENTVRVQFVRWYETEPSFDFEPLGKFTGKWRRRRMTLIQQAKCYVCDTQVFDNAQYCSECGFPLSSKYLKQAADILRPVRSGVVVEFDITKTRNEEWVLRDVETIGEDLYGEDMDAVRLLSSMAQIIEHKVRVQRAKAKKAQEQEQEKQKEQAAPSVDHQMKLAKLAENKLRADRQYVLSTLRERDIQLSHLKYLLYFVRSQLLLKKAPSALEAPFYVNRLSDLISKLEERDPSTNKRTSTNKRIEEIVNSIHELVCKEDAIARWLLDILTSSTTCTGKKFLDSFLDNPGRARQVLFLHAAECLVCEVDKDTGKRAPGDYDVIEFTKACVIAYEGKKTDPTFKVSSEAVNRVAQQLFDQKNKTGELPTLNVEFKKWKLERTPVQAAHAK